MADGAQSVPHLPTDVSTLGADFLAFSAHKMLGPTGIGVLWANEDLLASLPPFLGGGEMILRCAKGRVHAERHPLAVRGGDSPHDRGIGLGAAVDYPTAIGMEKIGPRAGPDRYAMRALPKGSATTSGFSAQAMRPAGRRTLAGYRDITPMLSQILDEYGVCIRAGHHCAKPYGLASTPRPGHRCLVQRSLRCGCADRGVGRSREVSSDERSPVS